MRDDILDAAVTLRRNYADLPFDAVISEETAHRVNERVAALLQRMEEPFAYFPLAGMAEADRDSLQEKRLLSPDAQEAPHGTAYLRGDGALCVEAAGEDHLILSAYDESGDLHRCLATCLQAEKQLENTGKMAYDSQFGHLTARPCDAGTGMRASMMLHLPMTVLVKQLPAAMKLAASSGMVLRNGKNGLCLLENRVTLGREEAVILEGLSQVAHKLCALEGELRRQARVRQDAAILDKVMRAYAIARFALRVGKKEALQLWSAMTLGISISDRMPYDAGTLEEMWKIAHLSARELLNGGEGNGDIARAQRIRALFNGGK